MSASMLAIVLVIALCTVCLALQRRWVPTWLRDPIRAAVNPSPRTVLVTGATGFIGRKWCRRVIERGDRLIVLTRDPRRAEYLFGPRVEYVTSLDRIASDRTIDAVVNLAGAPIMGGWWTQRRRKLLMDSRLDTTNAIVALIERLEHKPLVLVSMSAIGYYGVREDEEITEADRGRPEFQSHLCQAWELAAQRASQFGVRVCRLRTGLVLGREGGILPRFALGARLKVATTLGAGRQWLSWIHIDDLLRLIATCLDTPTWSGAFNATAPTPVRQRTFAQRLAQSFGGALTIAIPEQVLRLALGEMAQLLIAGQRVVPMRARAAGFTFRHASLDVALADLFATRQFVPSHIMYDPVCPVCDLEMHRYCKQAQRSGQRWSFADVAVSPEVIAQCGIDSDTARRRIYVIDDSGRILSGFDGLVAIWATLPGWRLLARVLGLPIVKRIASVVYDVMLAPAIWRWSTRRRARGVTGVVPSHS